ncbi:MAG: RNA polymerase sigma factor [Coprobacillaceae bacterium]
MEENKNYALVTIETIKQAQSGDKEAFTTIYKAYYNKIYFISKCFFRNDDEAAYDVVQDVFIKVYKKVYSLKDPKLFHAWIQRITYNECNDAARKRRKYIILDEAPDVNEFRDENQNEITEIIEDKRLMQIIINSIEEMSTPMKSVGMLRYYEGLQIEEIASVLKIPRGTVSSRLRKIKKVLKSNLTREEIIPENYNFAFLLPGVIQKAYQMLYELSIKDVQEDLTLLQKIIGTTGLAISTKIGISMIALVIVIGGGSVLFNTPVEKDTKVNKPIEQKQDVVVEEDAVIINVNFDNSWTKENVKIDVQTSNENYDEMLIDGNNILEVTDNGTYLVQLTKENKVIDQKEFIIFNIDRESPNGYYIKDKDQFTLFLEDNLSNIDVSKTLFYRNGIVSYEYYFNQEKNEIIVNSPIGFEDVFYIYDYAGNELEVIIK